MSSLKEDQHSIKKSIFWPAAIIISIFVVFALVAPNTLGAALGNVQSAIIHYFNWYYVLITTLFVVFCLFVGFSKLGNVKLGRENDEPEFSLGSWFSLLFAAGMGIGLVFYGVSEPLSHFANPKPGTIATSPEQQAQNALSLTFLHWGVHAWAIYVVVGLALAYAIHRRLRPLSIRWGLEGVFGRRIAGRWGDVVDIIALIGTVFGVATSLGFGVLQISAGLENLGIIESSTGLQIIIIAVITVFVLFSVVSGVAKGMKWLSNFNLILAAGLVVFVLIVGEGAFLFRTLVQSMGNYLQNFIGLSFNVSAFSGAEGEAWQAQWTSFYWGWWISWAPFVGIFIARISRGRTVREFVAGVLLVPTLVTMIWFTVLGGTALYRELYGQGGLVGSDGTVNIEAALFHMLEVLPGGPVLVVGAIILVAIFFITSSDSGALVMGMLATGGQAEPKVWIRVFFAIATAFLATALLLAGGLSAIQTAAITIALPFSIIMILMCVSTIRALRYDVMVERRKEQSRLARFVASFGSEDDDAAIEAEIAAEMALKKRRKLARVKKTESPNVTL